MISEQKVKNGFHNHHFPNGTFEFRHMRNRKVEKPYKPNGKHPFPKVTKTMQKPYKTNGILGILEPKSGKGLKMIKKH